MPQKKLSPLVKQREEAEKEFDAFFTEQMEELANDIFNDIKKGMWELAKRKSIRNDVSTTADSKQD